VLARVDVAWADRRWLGHGCGGRVLRLGDWLSQWSALRHAGGRLPGAAIAKAAVARRTDVHHVGEIQGLLMRRRSVHTE